ncbi:hypothetical protein AX774_g6067 [Zancudomyces culisetae]|uniref:Uncharacterized protein n=1 Tax=Zancudomyces culisetae TaxID=1213189 RepID=A0A1R1PHP6_ZANCU|nr:hypothetical protein AX774_g6067 [Zancudomyces culisetae]|eukprot:OMH80494.1 hypothetical protein AX774_g6067 [Zancudomyces culisetae]
METVTLILTSRPDESNIIDKSDYLIKAVAKDIPNQPGSADSTIYGDRGKFWKRKWKNLGWYKSKYHPEHQKYNVSGQQHHSIYDKWVCTVVFFSCDFMCCRKNTCKMLQDLEQQIVSNSRI